MFTAVSSISRLEIWKYNGAISLAPASLYGGLSLGRERKFTPSASPCKNSRIAARYRSCAAGVAPIAGLNARQASGRVCSALRRLIIAPLGACRREVAGGGELMFPPPQLAKPERTRARRPPYWNIKRYFLRQPHLGQIPSAPIKTPQHGQRSRVPETL